MLLAGAVCLLWLASGFYTVDPNQVGLNLVFGRYSGKTGPGLNYIWPEPIGSDHQAQRHRPQFHRHRRAGPHRFTGALADVPEESLMLTGDENIADVKFRVIWQIDPAHPEEFAFNIKNQGETIKAVAESAMREIVGRTKIQPLLTAERKIIEPAAQAAMQTMLDSYQAGVDHPAGAIAVGRSAAHRHRGLPRRDGGAAGPQPIRQRGAGAGQQHRAAGARRLRPHPARRRSLSQADGGGSARPDGALFEGVRGIQARPPR